MTRSLVAALGAAAVLSVAASAAAQTSPSAAPSPSGPIVNLGYAGGNVGGAVVEKFGAAGGAEAGFRIWKNLDVVGEVSWMQDLVNRREQDQAKILESYLATTTGQPAGSNVKVPSLYGGAGLRWVVEQAGRFRPYAIVTFGGTRMKRNSSFSVAGADVTGQLPQFGVTLGQDLTGTYKFTSISGGAGVLMAKGMWYFDAGVRMVSIDTNDSRTNASRLVLGGGYRF